MRQIRLALMFSAVMLLGACNHTDIDRTDECQPTYRSLGEPFVAHAGHWVIRYQGFVIGCGADINNLNGGDIALLRKKLEESPGNFDLKVWAWHDRLDFREQLASDFNDILDRPGVISDVLLTNMFINDQLGALKPPDGEEPDTPPPPPE